MFPLFFYNGNHEFILGERKRKIFSKLLFDMIFGMISQYTKDAELIHFIGLFSNFLRLYQYFYENIITFEF